MICCFNNTETNFNNNGLGVLDNDIVNPVVTEQLNGLFSFEFDYPIHGKHSGDLYSEQIVRCPVPDMNDQLFRIAERAEDIEGFLHIVAYHVFYDLATNLIEDTNIVNKDGAQAIAQILGATQYSHPFSGNSDIQTVNTARIVRHNPSKALLDGELSNGFRSRWGGEIIRDNFSISMQRVRGSDDGVQVRDKKNLTGYSSDVDFSSVVTRIMPQGFDGLFLPEKYVDSPLINNYVNPRIAVIRYDSVKAAIGQYANDDDAIPLSDAYDQLRELADKEYSVNHIDQASASYTVEFAPLERTEEYKEFAALETIAIGDTVSVVHEDYGISIKARMVSYQYDPLARAYISISLGSYSPKFTDVVKDIKHADDAARQAADDANYALKSANGKNTNYYGADTPSSPKEGDLWYKDNGDKLELWVYETRDGVAQWYPLISDLNQQEIKQELAQAQQDVEQAKDAADSALQAGQAAQQAADQAKLESEDAVAKADTAFSKAQDALDAADGLSLSIENQSKVINELAGASLVQPEWQQGSLSPGNGAEYDSASFVRSGFIGVNAGDRYVLQTYQGASAVSVYGTIFVFFYGESRAFLSYTTISIINADSPVVVPDSTRYLRIRLATTNAPSDIDCYIVAADSAGGYVNLTTLTNMVKIQATADTLMLTVSQTQADISQAQSEIGVPYMVSQWQQGSLSTTTGEEVAAINYVRSGYIDVSPGDKYIGQLKDGSQIVVYYHWFGLSVPYVDYVPAPKQYTEVITAGTYDNSAIIDYLNSKNVDGMSITGSASTNPFTSSGDFLVIYRIPLDGKDAPNVARWRGYRDASNSIVLLYTGGVWEQIGTVTASVYTVHEWTLDERQRAGITSGNVHIAFYSIKTGSYAGIYNQTLTPFTFNPMSDSLLYQISYAGYTAAVTVPASVVKMRVRANTTTPPDSYVGNVYAAVERRDYTKGNTLYSALLMQKDLINLRVSKNDVVNQINISTEGILISGSKIRITGQTTIDNAVIGTAMIADAAITNAKIANLDAAKINTGTLSADRIAAGSISSSKLTVADGYITNAMIADATIQSAKIATIDAATITTGTLSAARIGAGSITAAKVSSNFLEALTGTSSIRITGTTISYYNGNSLSTQINSTGLELDHTGVRVGVIGTSEFVNHPEWRTLSFSLNYEGSAMLWSTRQTSTSQYYTVNLAYYRNKLENGMEKGFNFDDVVYLKAGLSVASGNNMATVYTSYWELGSTPCYVINTSSTKAGIAMGVDNLILGDDGQWIDFGHIRETCKKLAGKTICFPTGFNSDGQATGWHSPVYFDSMSWWTR